MPKSPMQSMFLGSALGSIFRSKTGALRITEQGMLPGSDIRYFLFLSNCEELRAQFALDLSLMTS